MHNINFDLLKSKVPPDGYNETIRLKNEFALLETLREQAIQIYEDKEKRKRTELEALIKQYSQIATALNDANNKINEKYPDFAPLPVITVIKDINDLQVLIVRNHGTADSVSGSRPPSSPKSLGLSSAGLFSQSPQTTPASESGPDPSVAPSASPNL